MEGQMNFFELLKTPLEKASNYYEKAIALEDDCCYCKYDIRGICHCDKVCILGNQKVISGKQWEPYINQKL